MKNVGFLFMILVSCFALSQPTIKNCYVFPKNNIWNTPVDNLPVHPKSNDYINIIGAGLSLRNDFGSGLWNGAPIGIPYVLVGSNQKKVKVQFEYSDESDTAGYPIPDNPPIEGGNESTGDRHILIIDTNECVLYELYSAYQNEDKSWRAGSGAIFNLNSNELRPEGWTSADAAGLPIFPGLVKFEEVQAGEINHMIRFTAPKTQRKYLWPARHYASSITNENYPPMGIVMRLKSSFNTDKLGPQAKVIANALKKYGMILADNGSAWFISGVPDERWDMDDLYTLRQIKGSDFEAVDISSLMVDINSGEARNVSTFVNDSQDFGNVIYPNPAADYIAINFPLEEVTSGLDIKIYNTLGECVMNVGANNYLSLQRIDISNLTVGLYLIQIGNYTEKFVVVR
jgi:hypothetical protein